MCHNREDAEDILQETFLSAFKNLSRFREKSKFSTWLFRIATNFCLMLRRKVKKETVPFDDSLDPHKAGLIGELYPWSSDPRRNLSDKELKRILDKVIRQLPEKYRIVFLLKDVEGFSNKEIAKILGLSLAAAKARLLRSRLFLREKLSKYFKETKDGRVFTAT